LWFSHRTGALAVEGFAAPAALHNEKAPVKNNEGAVLASPAGSLSRLTFSRRQFSKFAATVLDNPATVGTQKGLGGEAGPPALPDGLLPAVGEARRPSAGTWSQAVKSTGTRRLACSRITHTKCH
jgi:hypothetical protein